MIFTRRLTRTLLAGSIAGAVLSGCAGLPDPLAIAGKAAGRAVGARIAKATPPAAAVVVKPRGGAFCSTMDGIGRGIGRENGFPPFGPGDVLQRPMAEWTVGIAETGEKYCNWKAPKP